MIFNPPFYCNLKEDAIANVLIQENKITPEGIVNASNTAKVDEQDFEISQEIREKILLIYRHAIRIYGRCPLLPLDVSLSPDRVGPNI